LFEGFADGVDCIFLCSLQMQSVVLYNYGHKLYLSFMGTVLALLNRPEDSSNVLVIVTTWFATRMSL